MAMKKMDPIFLFNLMLIVRSELLEARGTSREQEPAQVGSLLEESCCKNHIKNLWKRVAAASEQELLRKKLALKLLTPGTHGRLPLTNAYTQLPVLFTQQQKLCRQWGDFTDYSLTQKGAPKIYTIFGFCFSLCFHFGFHYRLTISVMTLHPVPPNCACSGVEFSAFIFI